MLASVPTAALAATITGSTSGAGTDVTKTWSAADSAMLNRNESFKFTVTYDQSNSVKAGTNELVPPTVPGSFTLTTDWTKKDAVAKTTIGKIFEGVDFTAPGSYFYTVAETPGTNHNITYDTARYTVIVNVEWANGADQSRGTAVKSVVVRTNATDSTAKASALAFRNTANANVGSLRVSNAVAGTAANTADKFKFSLTLGGNASGSYSIKIDGKDAGTVTANEAKQFELAHNQKLVIENLPVGTTWSVTETDSLGYDSTEVTASEGDSADAANKNASGNVAAKDQADTAAFLNEMGFAPQTGITANTLAFVGVAAIAVAGGVTLVISRKRRAGEDF